MSDIIVNTYTLRQCADRLGAVKKRVSNLEYRLERLYKNTGLIALLQVLQDNELHWYARRLTQCSDYLLLTASDFERAEEGVYVEKISPKNYTFAGVGTILSEVINSRTTTECPDMAGANDKLGRAAEMFSGSTNITGVLHADDSFPDSTIVRNATGEALSAEKDVEKDDFKEKTLSEYMKWLKSDWVDDEFEEYPIWMREGIKESLKDIYKNTVGDNFLTFYDFTQKLSEGDYIGALKKYANHVYKEKGFFNSLAPKFYVNSIFGGLEGFERFCEQPTLTNLFGIGWESSIGAVLETSGDAAWDVVKLIPGVSDWYESHGASDSGSAFNVMYTEWTRAIFGDSTADYVSTYYADNGGLFSGLVNGGEQIINEIQDSCKKHGGIVGVWLNGWNSIFH